MTAELWKGSRATAEIYTCRQRHSAGAAHLKSVQPAPYLHRIIKVILEIRKVSRISTTKSGVARNTNSKMIRQVVNDIQVILTKVHPKSHSLCTGKLCDLVVITNRDNDPNNKKLNPSWIKRELFFVAITMILKILNPNEITEQSPKEVFTCLFRYKFCLCHYLAWWFYMCCLTEKFLHLRKQSQHI